MKHFIWIGFFMLTSCGVPQTSSQLDIIGGTEPASDSLIIKNTAALLDNGSTVCTVVIASESIAVTAAHCVLEDMLADWSLAFTTNVNNGVNRQQLRKVTEINTHPDYGFMSTNYDVAWLKFRGGLPYGYRPATFHGAPENMEPQSELILAGYGMTNDDLNSNGKLFQVDTIFRAFLDEHPHKGLIIFGPTPDKSACYGDSGGPMFVETEDELLVAGLAHGPDWILNQTYDCYSGAGIYTSVAAYRDWFEETSNQVFQWSE